MGSKPSGKTVQSNPNASSSSPPTQNPSPTTPQPVVETISPSPSAPPSSQPPPPPPQPPSGLPSNPSPESNTSLSPVSTNSSVTSTESKSQTTNSVVVSPTSPASPASTQPSPNSLPASPASPASPVVPVSTTTTTTTSATYISPPFQSIKKTPSASDEIDIRYFQINKLDRKGCEKQYKYDDFQDKLGAGTFGDVYNVCLNELKTRNSKYKKSGQVERKCPYVMKVQRLNNEEEKENVINEIRIHRKLNQISKETGQLIAPELIDAWFCTPTKQKKEYCYMIIDLWDGTLHDLLMKQAEDESMEGDENRVIYVSQLTKLVDLVQRLDKAGIMHGDLSKQNILYRGDRSKPDQLEFVLNDFGFSIETDDKDKFFRRFRRTHLNGFNYYIPCDIAQNRMDDIELEKLWKISPQINMFVLESLFTWISSSIQGHLLDAPLLGHGVKPEEILFLGFKPSSNTLKDFTTSCKEKYKKWLDFIQNSYTKGKGQFYDINLRKKVAGSI